MNGGRHQLSPTPFTISRTPTKETEMLKNLFALIGVAVAIKKIGDWYMDYQALQEENRELKAECRGRQEATS
jgi:hypothetical protein